MSVPPASQRLPQPVVPPIGLMPQQGPPSKAAPSTNNQVPPEPEAPFSVLGPVYTVARIATIITLIPIMGMTAKFVNAMIKAKEPTPSVLVGTLTTVCIAIVYVSSTYALYYLDKGPPFLLLINTILDSLLLGALIAISVLVGRPFSYLNCKVLPSGGIERSFLISVSNNFNEKNSFVWNGASKAVCYEFKAIWGLCILLCVVFTVSCGVSGALWFQRRKGFVKLGEGTDTA